MLNRTIAKRSLATAAQVEHILPKKYGGRFTVTLIPGDGVGKEVTDSVKTIFEAENIPIDWETINIKQTDHKEGSQWGRRVSKEEQDRPQRVMAHACRPNRPWLVKRRFA